MKITAARGEVIVAAAATTTASVCISPRCKVGTCNRQIKSNRLILF